MYYHVTIYDQGVEVDDQMLTEEDLNACTEYCYQQGYEVQYETL